LADNRRFRFGIFDFDADTLELRKAQRPVRLRPQSLKLLRLLVSRPRQLISRDEIHKELWAADVFVDFEQGVNHSVKQLRAALGDDADTPRYIETLPRRGYRFIAQVELSTEVEEPACLPSTNGHRRSFSRLQSSTEYVATQVARHKAGTALIACALALIVGGAWWAVSSQWFALYHTRSVAVLPFSTIGGGDQYFADGITECARRSESRPIGRSESRPPEGGSFYALLI
jgi:DNA-binding winged helix-turn-helix (wHTH) protein